MFRFVSILRREFAAMLWPFLFFAVCFNALTLTVALMSPTHDFSLLGHGTALLGALIVAKAVLVADHLPLVNRYPDRPLVYNVVWKAMLYLVVAVLFRLIERLVAAATDEAGFGAGVARVVAELDWGRLAAVQMWLAILFLVYTAAREITRVVGVERVRTMLFGTPSGALDP